MSLYVDRLYPDKRRNIEVLFTRSEGMVSSMPGYRSFQFELEEENDLSALKTLFSHVESMKIDMFEFVLSGEDEARFESLLRYACEYLFQRDLSVGLLTKRNDFIFIHASTLKEYGVAFIAPYPPVAMREVPANKGIMPACKPPLAAMCDACYEFEVMPSKEIRLGETFHEKLMRFLRNSGKENVVVYSRGGISRQVFSKIISTPTMIPTKATVICLALGLELSLERATELLESAGYALSNSLMADAIVSRFIKQRIFDLYRINVALSNAGCPLLGWHPR